MEQGKILMMHHLPRLCLQVIETKVPKTKSEIDNGPPNNPRSKYTDLLNDTELCVLPNLRLAIATSNLLGAFSFNDPEYTILYYILEENFGRI